MSARTASLVALPLVVAVAAGLAYSLTRPTLYRAEAKILVTKGAAPATAADREAGRPLVQTLADLLDSDIVATGVVQSLGLPQTPDGLRRRLDVSARPDSAVIDARFDAPSREEAVRVLQQAGLLFSQRIQQRFEGAVGASIFDPPHALPDRVSPRPVRDTLLAGAAGLALALLLLLTAAVTRRAPAVDRAREAELAAREQELARRLALLHRDEQRLEQRRAEPPPPKPSETPAVPASGTGADPRGPEGGYQVAALTSLVERAAGSVPPERVETWRTYLSALRAETGDGDVLPREFDELVEDVFGELLARMPA